MPLKSKNICIFEDECSGNFLPLAYTRPVFELYCGMGSLREKIEHAYPSVGVHLLCREYLVPVVKEKINKAISVNDTKSLGEGNCLFINGRILAAGDLSGKVPLRGAEEAGFSGSTLVYARLAGATLKKIIQEAKETEKIISAISKAEIKKGKTELTLLSYPWDLIKYNSQALREDYRRMGKKSGAGNLDKQVVVSGDKSQLYVGEKAQVEAKVVLNLEAGPIYISKQAKIRPFTVIDGPAFIGEGALIDGAKLHGGCSIGPHCAIGGEIEASIIQGYSNKHHEGFLGHSYLGEWVNLGAMTTTSNLKNNYGEVKVYTGGKLVNSGEIKVGSFIADHAKLGIGTLLNTGTVIGVAANIFGGMPPPKFIPSFSWGEGAEFVEHNLKKALETAGKVTRRRGLHLSPAQDSLLRQIYEMTESERVKAGVGEKH